MDVQTGEADIGNLGPGVFPRPGADPRGIPQAAAALRSARAPFIFAGGGVESASATAPLARLAEALGAPVVTSVFGRGAISDRPPLALGDGWGRLSLYEELFTQAELVLVVGSRIDVVSDANLGARFPARMVQVDIDPRVIGQRRRVEVGVVADAASALEALCAELAGDAARACWFDVGEFLARKHAVLRDHAGEVVPIIEDLRAALPDDTIFVDDLTLVGYWMPLLMPTFEPRTLIHPGTYGTLGYSLPAAIGAKLACPKQLVVSLSGDGGFLFTVQELATARSLDLGLIVVVFNDNACHPHLSGPGLQRAAHRLGSGEPGLRKAGRGLWRARAPRGAVRTEGGCAPGARRRWVVAPRSALCSVGVRQPGSLDAVSQATWPQRHRRISGMSSPFSVM